MSQEGAIKSMRGGEKKSLSKEAFEHMLVVSGLELDNQDLESLAPRTSLLLQTLTSLGEMDLGDVEPILMLDISKGG